MKIKAGYTILRWPMLLLSVAFAFLSVSAIADETQSIDALEHKEKSTLETFHLKPIDSEELSAAVIAGGLEPTSSGGQRNQPVTVYEDVSTILEPARDRQTDLGRYEIPARVNYSEPKYVEGMTFGSSYSISPPTNRTYNNYQTTTTER